METVLDLPSKGVVYNVPLDKITVRTLRGGDEKILAELSIDNIELKYLALLNNRIRGGDPVVKGIDPSKLTFGDRIYILLWLRINSYSPIFKSSLTCSTCFQNVNIQIDLTKIKEKTLPEGFVEPQVVTLDNGEQIKLRLFRVEDEIKAYEKEKKDGLEAAYLYRLALSIVDDKSIPDRIIFLEDLKTQDLSKIKLFHESHVHGPILDNIEYTCPECKGVGVCALPFRPDFLQPSGTEVN